MKSDSRSPARREHRRVRGLILVAACLVAACGAADAAAPGRDAASEATARPGAPSATPTFVPAPAMITGKLSALGRDTLTVTTLEHGDVIVDTSGVRDVWRERSVSTSALRVGDDLSVSGASARQAFVATYIYANIGRLDGVIARIAGNDLLLRVTRNGMSRTVAATLSRFLRNDSVTLADVRVGDTIGSVVYYERGPDGQIAFRRITKMWHD